MDETRRGPQFCKACRVALAIGEREYCEECKSNLLLESADKYEQLDISQEYWKYVGGNHAETKT